MKIKQSSLYQIMCHFLLEKNALIYEYFNIKLILNCSNGITAR